MDIFNYFISNHNENTPKFSEVFHSTNELKLILDDKSYVLDYYLSMFFRLIKQMDFTYLQEKIHCLFKKSIENSLNLEEKNLRIHYQEPKTNENLLILSVADSIIKQSFSDFTTEIYYHCCKKVDVIEFQETENKLINLIDEQKFEAFQLMLNQYFIATSFAQFFLQVMIKELSLALTALDIETDNEIFRLFLKKFIIFFILNKANLLRLAL